MWQNSSQLQWFGIGPWPIATIVFVNGINAANLWPFATVVSYGTYVAIFWRIGRVIR
jgi:hypothetical protein